MVRSAFFGPPLRSDLMCSAVKIFASSGTLPVPKVSTASDMGWAMPMA